LLRKVATGLRHRSSGMEDLTAFEDAGVARIRISGK
jgi:hypothetical protein